MSHAELCPTCEGSGKLEPSGTSSDGTLRICHGCKNGCGWVEVGGWQEYPNGTVLRIIDGELFRVDPGSPPKETVYIPYYVLYQPLIPSTPYTPWEPPYSPYAGPYTTCGTDGGYVNAQ